MKATLIYGAGDVRVEDLPEPAILERTDALVRVTRACVCGSDLHPYHSLAASEHGTTMGHEFIGVVEEVGADVAGLTVGDFVIAPFVYSDNTCEFCREGLQTSCVHGGFWNRAALHVGGGQAEAVRVPQADGTLVVVPGTIDAAQFAGLLTLTDVYCTGYHAAVTAGIGPGSTVTVIGDGAVGLLAVLSAKGLGAEQIILMGRHEARTDLGRRFGATDVVAERGEEGIARVVELSGGRGSRAVIDAVGYLSAYEQVLGVVRDGGTISRVGMPQYTEAPLGPAEFRRNLTITGGVAPARAYIDRLLPGVLDGSVEPGLVFDRELGLEETPQAYRLMDQREALKVMIRP